ncbi:MAG: DUF3109 family protein [Culturomica sp.]|jgi:hypothetical protein|nr:DUF3109 family protein [Culturomica sp.]
MVEIGDVLVSLDVLEKKFSCDLNECHGVCCLDGDAGAPLEKHEIAAIRKNYSAIRNFMKESGVEAVKQQGYYMCDQEGDTVTPLIKGMECAYSIVENGNYCCAFEKAWIQGKSNFRKPISCHLYPIRIIKLSARKALNYHSWNVCKAAVDKGEREGVYLYEFLKEPLTAMFGKDWYEELILVAKEWEKSKNISIFAP